MHIACLFALRPSLAWLTLSKGATGLLSVLRVSTRFTSMDSFIQLESHSNELATSVREPTDFLHHLASQVCNFRYQMNSIDLEADRFTYI